MRGVPRSPYKDGKYNEGSHDNGERSAANRAFPILTITHSVLPTDIEGERGCPRDGSPFSTLGSREHDPEKTRVSLETNAKRLPADHAQTISWSVVTFHLEVIALQGRA
jgi:hypothetical protein